MLKNTKVVVLLGLFFAGRVGADDVFIPTEKFDLSNIPPMSIDLAKHEQQDKEKESLKEIEKIVEQVVHGDNATLEKEAAYLANDKDKLENFLKILPEGVLKKDKKIEAAASGNVKAVVIPKEVKDLLSKQYQDAVLVGQKVTLKFKKASIAEVVELISKTTGLKFVVDSDVEGFVNNVDFQDFSVAFVLYFLFNNNSPKLALLKDRNVWRVMLFSSALEAFQDMAEDLREKDYQSSCVTMYYVRWDDAFKTRIEKLWQGITGPDFGKKGSYVIFDDVSKKIFFRGRSQQVKDLGRVLAEFDVKVPQIRVEARVVIANKDFDEALGFQWSGIYDRSASVKRFDFVGVGNNTKDEHSPFSKDLYNWSLNLLPSVVTTPLIKIPVIFGNHLMTTKRLNLLLNAAENRSEIKTILKPCLFVNNEEMAEILVGQQLPQQTRLDQTVEGQLSNLTTVNYKDIGTCIKVKPVVAPDHESVFLDIFVESSYVATPRIETEIGGVKANYVIETSRSKNRVLLKSGQSTLIGGLIINSDEKHKTGVPGLQDIPVLGWLFQGQQKVKAEKQILIYITPTLV